MHSTKESVNDDDGIKDSTKESQHKRSTKKSVNDDIIQ